MVSRKKSDLEERADKITDTSERIGRIIEELESSVTGIVVPAKAAREGKDFKEALRNFCKSLRNFVKHARA